MNGHFASCAALVLFALNPVAAAGAGHEQTETRDGVVARLRVEAEPPRPMGSDEKVEVGLSGELVVTLTVEVPATVALGPLPFITASKAWRQRDPVKGWETTELKEGWVRRRQTYRLTPWQLGEVPLPLLSLKYRKDRGSEEWEEVAWKPLAVLVTTLLREANLRSARDITGMEELPAERGPGPGIALAAGAAAVTLVLAGWLLWRRRTRTVAPMPPDEWALGELARLGEASPTSDAEVERFHTRLSEILRQYLERRFGFHAPQQTTPEFLEAARQSPQLTAEHQAMLRGLLEQCDLAKFARSQPAPEECRAAVRGARSFVEATRPRIV